MTRGNSGHGLREGLLFGGVIVLFGLVFATLGPAYGTRMIGADALGSSEFQTIAGPAGNGTIFSGEADPRKLNSARDLVARIAARDTVPQPYTVYAYAAVETLVQAIDAAGPGDYRALSDMGSEGYLINQFTTLRCNNRTDEWGGSAENRRRLPVEIVRRVRDVCGSNCLLVYRISAADLVEGGATGDEITSLAKAIEAAGADVLNTGIGWHEARVPTIAYMVPRAAWRTAAARVKQAVSIPVIASNRINTPELAEDIIASGDADLVSMAHRTWVKGYQDSPIRMGGEIDFYSVHLDPS